MKIERITFLTENKIDVNKIISVLEKNINSIKEIIRLFHKFCKN